MRKNLYFPLMTPKLNILVSEDDPLIQDSLKFLLSQHHARTFRCLPELVKGTSSHTRCDLAILDLMHPGDPTGDTSIELIKTMKKRYPLAEIVIHSGVDDIQCMRKCLEQGATKYILKEHMSAEIPQLLERTLCLKKLKEEIDALIIGQSPLIQKLKSRLCSLRIDNDIDVLIEGETGTGKELCAQALHGKGPFISINASAVPSELFESEFFGAEKGAYTGSDKMRKGHLENAGEGVLFIDEIQALPLAQQSKLLRLLETRKYSRVGSSTELDFKGRIVSASNENLRSLCQSHKFREDLYYRLSSFTVHVPPLRMRRQDIPLLVDYFLKQFSKAPQKILTPEALDKLSFDYDWPGNIRELRNTIRKLAIDLPLPKVGVQEINTLLEETELNLSIESDSNPFQVQWEEGFDYNVEQLERYMLKEMLAKNKSTTAREKLKLSRSRFYEKLKKFELLN